MKELLNRLLSCLDRKPKALATHTVEIVATPTTYHWAISAADVMPVPVMILDPGWRIVALNGEARRWFDGKAPVMDETHLLDCAARFACGEDILAALDTVAESGPLSAHHRTISVARLEEGGRVLGYWVTSDE